MFFLPGAPRTRLDFRGAASGERRMNGARLLRSLVTLHPHEHHSSFQQVVILSMPDIKDSKEGLIELIRTQTDQLVL